jgi:hypothetical protein
MLRRLLRAPLTWVVLAVLVAGGTFGMYWFQPWKLFTSTTVNDALSSPAPSAPPPPAATASTAPASAAAPAGPAVVRQGAFVTHEHDTAGGARIVRTASGGVQLELVGLSTSDGPDLRVWLTDQEVKTGTAGWRVFDDGRYVELGRLKGNRGDQVYPIGADVDLAGFRSVTIWCKRFAVSFGAAELR